MFCTLVLRSAAVAGGDEWMKSPTAQMPERYRPLMNQSAMHRINLRILMGCFLLITFLSYFSFMGAWADEDGNADTILEKMLSASFNIFRFPTHTLFWETFRSGNIFIYGLMFNSLLYSLVCERLITFFQRKKKLRKEKTQINGL